MFEAQAYGYKGIDNKDRQDRMRIIITNDTQSRVHLIETCMCKQAPLPMRVDVYFAASALHRASGCVTRKLDRTNKAP